jgi:hypothetical protein
MVHKNARLKLREYEYERHTFTAEFIRYGHAANNMLTTVLLNDVKDESGVVVASHIWLSKAKLFYDAKLTNGDVVQFTGLVMRYKKGSYGTVTDFTICNTSNVKNISDIENKVPYI